MSTMRGSANYPGLMPFKLSDEPPPNRPILENERFASGQPSRRKRASRALYGFLIAFCGGVAATLAGQWYGDESREMIAKSYPQLGWLAVRPVSTAQNAPGMFGLAAPAAPFDQLELRASLEAMRQSIDRIVAGHELMMGSIDQIVSRVAADHEQLTRNSAQTATSITTGQGEMTRSTDHNIATSQKQIAGSLDQTATGISQAPPAKASGITVGSRADRASLEPTAARLDVKPTEARPPHTSSARGKPVYAASGHDRSSQKQIAAGIDQTATDMSQAPSAKAGGNTVESRADRPSLQPTTRLDVSPPRRDRHIHRQKEESSFSAVSAHDRFSQEQIAGSIDQTATDSYRQTHREKGESWSPPREGMTVPVKSRWRVASIRPPPTVLSLPRPRPVALR
jgi:hypothetical protein